MKNLTQSDILLLTSALENFINNEIHDIPAIEKLLDNVIAKDLISKYKNRETQFSLDEIRVSFNSLQFLLEMINVANMHDKQSVKYSKQIQSLMDTFYPILVQTFN